MGSTSLKGWIEAVVAAGVSVLLSFLAIQLGDYLIVLALVPLVYIALRRGLLQGLFASLLTGLLIFLLNQGEGDTVAGLVSHFGPYAFVGVSGLFAKNTQRTLNNKRFPNAALNIVTASVLASLVYFLWLLIDNGALSTEWIGFAITSAVVTVILLVAAKVSSKLFVPKDTPFLSRKEKSRLLND